MTTTNRPIIPDAVPQYIADGLGRQDSDSLCAIAAYAEELAEYQEAEAKAELEEQDEEIVREESYDDPDRPDDVPGKACVTIKEINDNKYYYQWRAGSKIKSKYKAPVSPSK